jgi:hypothetical protein
MSLSRLHFLLPCLSLLACGGADPLEDVSSLEAPLTRCESAFTPPARSGFRHWYNSLLALGPAWHSAQDVVSTPGAAVTVEGKFAYGSVSKDLEDETAQLFINDCTGWRAIGSALTDSDGRARVRFTAPSSPGLYALRLVVRGDATQTSGYLAVAPRGSRLTVFDIDGTLTTSDMELVKDVITDLFEPILRGTYVPMAYPYARELVEERERRGGFPIYLTARPYWLTQSSREWLSGLRFPVGALHTTDSNSEALTRVAEYKTEYLNSLKAQGFVLEAGYGNATTDIEAFDGAGIPKTDTFIIGKNGGKSGTRGACAANPTCGTWAEEVTRLKYLP